LSAPEPNADEGPPGAVLPFRGLSSSLQGASCRARPTVPRPRAVWSEAGTLLQWGLEWILHTDYERAAEIPPASPAPRQRCVLAGVSCGRCCPLVSPADSSTSTATMGIDRKIDRAVCPVLRAFLLVGICRGRCGRYLTRFGPGGFLSRPLIGPYAAHFAKSLRRRARTRVGRRYQHTRKTAPAGPASVNTLEGHSAAAGPCSSRAPNSPTLLLARPLLPGGCPAARATPHPRRSLPACW
jgi:hypothetical protein